MTDSAATGNPPCVVPLIPPTTNNPQAVEWKSHADLGFYRGEPAGYVGGYCDRIMDDGDACDDDSTYLIDERSCTN